MNLRSSGLAACLLASVSACTTMPAPGGEEPIRVREPSGECDAAPAQSLVGRQASETVGARALELARAANLRWIPPRTAVTMDYRADRLNISYDDDLVILRVYCG
ncbi:I78 family peptidase inhibitor [Aurantiacibacter spongiae]|uniref:Peptidase inhibitor I78 n=1 Tax=Aurantiacibacter spongiae TaxID=2488860 RepID=A0A3N5CPP1_9SPHN|nr:I78 family peptidase inhibitor [Aurantiacibacter spongiae]RPF70973.1 hypothetical protein EG799_04585 [Aurantiacibacter spongiae]